MQWRMAVSFAEALTMAVGVEQRRALEQAFWSCSDDEASRIAIGAVLLKIISSDAQDVDSVVTSVIEHFLNVIEVDSTDAHLEISKYFISSFWKYLPPDSACFSRLSTAWIQSLNLLMKPDNGVYMYRDTTKVILLGEMLESTDLRSCGIYAESIVEDIFLCIETNRIHGTLLISGLVGPLFRSYLTHSDPPELKGLIKRSWRLCAAILGDLLASSSLICLMHQHFSSTSKFHELRPDLFNDEIFWGLVQRCFLSEDVVMRKRGGLLVEQFLQAAEPKEHASRDDSSCRKPAKAGPRAAAAPRHWLHDFIEAYRQIEGCSYLHLIFQVSLAGPPTCARSGANE